MPAQGGAAREPARVLAQQSRVNELVEVGARHGRRGKRPQVSDRHVTERGAPVKHHGIAAGEVKDELGAWRGQPHGAVRVDGAVR
ncbi:hypothetical protein [Demequina litorisediminis]|uniref:hypothetical protein n=1 Tax=Demequina litorisediminis TaxID=1849022 RepID=UPI0024E07DAA|nr:hypothetical protein [Demequina litorisediminis]